MKFLADQLGKVLAWLDPDFRTEKTKAQDQKELALILKNSESTKKHLEFMEKQAQEVKQQTEVNEKARKDLEESKEFFKSRRNVQVCNTEFAELQIAVGTGKDYKKPLSILENCLRLVELQKEQTVQKH